MNKANLFRLFISAGVQKKVMATLLFTITHYCKEKTFISC